MREIWIKPVNPAGVRDGRPFTGINFMVDYIMGDTIHPVMLPDCALLLPANAIVVEVTYADKVDKTTYLRRFAVLNVDRWEMLDWSPYFDRYADNDAFIERITALRDQANIPMGLVRLYKHRIDILAEVKKLQKQLETVDAQISLTIAKNDPAKAPETVH